MFQGRCPLTLGEYLRQAREQRGLSREEVAAAVGWSHPNSVAHVESGARDVPRELLPRLLTALAVPEAEWPEVLRLPRERLDDETTSQGGTSSPHL